MTTPTPICIGQRVSLAEENLLGSFISIGTVTAIYWDQPRDIEVCNLDLDDGSHRTHTWVYNCKPIFTFKQGGAG